MSSPGQVLLIDDDGDIAKAVAFALARVGLTVDHAETPDLAYGMLATGAYRAVILDLNFSRGQTDGKEGFACLSRILRDDPDAVVVVLTAHSGIRVAVAAMRVGAFDFVMKPWRNAELVERVEAAVAMRRDREELADRRGEVAGRDRVRLIGNSPAIDHVRVLIGRVAPTTAGVLLVGPRGSGRRLAARAIHAASRVAQNELIELDARLAVAADDRDGAAALARSAHATLFLSEVDRLDDVEQARLLSRLPATARLISAAQVADRLTPTTRARLATIEMPIPALADRDGDAMVLARHFAVVAARKYGQPIPRFTPPAQQLILAIGWDDEVRGLERAIEHAVLLGDSGRIDVADLGLVAPDPDGLEHSRSTLHASERALVVSALEANGSIARAAQELGISRASLYRRMAKYGL